MKRRVDAYLDPDTFKQLARAATQAGASRSSLVEAAVAAFLSSDGIDKREAVFTRRLDRLTRQYGKLDRNLTILTETLALFIHYQLAIAPPIPVDDEAAIKAQGRERFEAFVARLGRRLADSKSLVRDVIDQVRPQANDFYSIDLGASDG